MPRQSYKILNFDGGRNSKYEARDIQENELAEAINLDISNPGYVQLGGNFLSDASEIDDATVSAFTAYNSDLFAFAHDYEIAFTLNYTDGSAAINVGDTVTGATSASSGVVIKNTISSGSTGGNDAAGTLYLINVTGSGETAPFTNDENLQVSAATKAVADGTGSAPAETTKPITVLADADKIDFFDHLTDEWYTDVLDVGVTTATNTVNYYFYDGALRVSDGTHSNENAPVWFGHIKKNMMVGLLESDDTESSNKPKINTWFKDALTPSPPASAQNNRGLEVYDSYSSETYPSSNEEVVLRFKERTADELDLTAIAVDDTTNIATATCADHSTLGFGPGMKVIVTGSANHSGEHEIVGIGSTTTFTFQALNTTDESGISAKVRKEVDSINDSIKDKWAFGMSFVYDKNQESLIVPGWKYDGAGSSDSDYNEMGLQSGANYVVDFTGYNNEPECFIGFQYGMRARQWSSRIKGFKIYMKRIGNTGAEGDWLLFCDVDLERGEYRIVAGADTWRPLHENASNNYQINNNTGLDEVTNLPFDTYESENLFPPDVDVISASWKTAAIVNRTTYAGNVLVNGRSYPDRVIKSAILKPDVFPNTAANQIDVIAADGDEITHLEGFGDRLFIFKRNSLVVINTAGQSGEFIEATMPNLGVSDSRKVCKAEGGLVWMNTQGLYFFDGKNTTNLIEGKFDPTVWSGYTGLNSNVSCIGYSPLDKKLNILIYRIPAANYGYVYDFETKAFFYQSATFSLSSSNAYNSNMVTLPITNELVIAEATDSTTAVDFKKWSQAPQNSLANANVIEGMGVTLRTKDIDFGEPGVRKKIYKVYITYKTGAGSSSASDIGVSYQVNGEDSMTDTLGDWTSSKKEFKAVSDCTVDSGVCYLDASKGEWTTAIMRPATSSEANNIYSFQLGIYNKSTHDIHSDFKINDITIIYRIKPIR
tara:strand:+ start:391 stop:3210 length:2820 start_codon:yes stop_codon:yes gene_type:complete